MKNKYLHLLCAQFIILFTFSSLNFAQSFNWAVKAGGSSWETGQDIYIDSNGNSFIIGYFEGTANFGLHQLVSNGNSDIFIAKYDTIGNCLWAAKAGGVYTDLGNSISMDANGNIYIIGRFIDTAAFGTIQLVSAGSADIFIAKYDTSGNCLWAVNAGGIGYEDGSSIITDSNGNSFITGYFEGTSTFGTYSLVSYGSYDIFIAKYDTNGNCMWAVKAGGISSDVGNCIKTDIQGNICITGGFVNTATFGSNQLISAGSADIFIAKYDTSGNCLWAVNAGGGSSDVGYGIATDLNGNTFVAGNFGDTATFGIYQLVSNGNSDIFIAKYDTIGNCLWAVNAGGSSSDNGGSISLDSNGASFVTGGFVGTAEFGNTSLVSYGSTDIFIAKYDTNGNCMWAVKAGSISSDIGTSISTDQYGVSYVTGNFSGTANFGNVQLVSYGNEDIFIAKFEYSIPPISLLSPIGGEAWEVGSNKEISWASIDISDVKIEYSTNNGNTWITIITSIPAANGTYAWTIPNTPANYCRVRIADVSNPSANAISASNFIIYPPNDVVNFSRIEFYTNVGTSTSNPNNYINPGKAIRLRLKINNGLATNILTGYGTIRTITPGVTVIDSTGTFNNIIAGQAGWSLDDYEIEVSSAIPLGSRIDLLLIVTQALTPTGPWRSIVSFPIAPLRVNQILLDDDEYPDSYGNNNQIPEPNETVEVIPLLTNISSQSIYSAKGTLRTELSGLNIWNNVTGASGTVYDSWRYNVVSGIPQPIGAGSIDIQPELDYVFGYANISPYTNLPFALYYDAYLEVDPGATWDTGGILMKWEDPFEMANGIVSSVDENVSTDLIPHKMALQQNYPNPFNPSTKLSYSIIQSGLVTLKIFDVLGKEIETLVNEEKSIGTYWLNWNAVNLPSGVYFYQLRAGNFVETKKMVLLK